MDNFQIVWALAFFTLMVGWSLTDHRWLRWPFLVAAAVMVILTPDWHIQILGGVLLLPRVINQIRYHRFGGEPNPLYEAFVRYPAITAAVMSGIFTFRVSALSHINMLTLFYPPLARALGSNPAGNLHTMMDHMPSYQNEMRAILYSDPSLGGLENALSTVQAKAAQIGYIVSAVAAALLLMIAIVGSVLVALLSTQL